MAKKDKPKSAAARHRNPDRPNGKSFKQNIKPRRCGRGLFGYSMATLERKAAEQKVPLGILVEMLAVRVAEKRFAARRSTSGPRFIKVDKMSTVDRHFDKRLVPPKIRRSSDESLPKGKSKKVSSRGGGSGIPKPRQSNDAGTELART